VRAFIVSAGLSAGLVLLSMPAHADSSYTSECHREGPAVVCQSERRSAAGTTTSECVRERGTLECTSSHKSKPRSEPERPVLPPSVEHTGAGVTIMRGMPR